MGSRWRDDAPFGVRKQMNRVMMFHIGRSGSQVLGSLLKQHPQVHWADEVFIEPLKEARRRELPKPTVVEPYDFLSAKFATCQAQILGGEVKFFHLRLLDQTVPQFIKNLQKLGFEHFIILKRKNYLRKVVSSLIAHQTNQWHRRPSQPEQLTRIWLDTENVQIDWAQKPLLDYFHQYDADFAAAQKYLSSCSVQMVSYEAHILPDPVIGYRLCCRFLGIPSTEVTVPYGRTNPFPLRKILLNFDEVASLLQNTPYEWMLTDKIQEES